MKLFIITSIGLFLCLSHICLAMERSKENEFTPFPTNYTQHNQTNEKLTKKKLLEVIISQYKLLTQVIIEMNSDFNKKQSEPLKKILLEQSNEIKKLQDEIKVLKQNNGSYFLFPPIFENNDEGSILHSYYLEDPDEQKSNIFKPVEEDVDKKNSLENIVFGDFSMEELKNLKTGNVFLPPAN